ncbi:hypothetical protein CEXT_335711 [Caerostris extrusa]|uniref:Ycf15 n=1 Tax=Caerostris extrusa TaxID=172846 RepID=A0AAV4ME76_CAEEX|nr:hypothetical protein CEXT_335711 [Caerostris extrusa]
MSMLPRCFQSVHIETFMWSRTNRMNIEYANPERFPRTSSYAEESTQGDEELTPHPRRSCGKYMLWVERRAINDLTGNFSGKNSPTAFRGNPLE